MKLNNAKEFFEAAPKGRYKVRLVSVTCENSKKTGASMLKLVAEIIEGEHQGKQVFDYAITVEEWNGEKVKGAGMGKGKLRQLGVNVDSDVEIPDDQIAAQLLNIECFAELDVEPAMQQDGKTPKTVFDPATQKTVPQMNNKVVAYFTAPITAQQPAIPAKAASPAQYASMPGAAAPAPAAPAAPPQQVYKVGDVVNGHRLTAQGTWEPVPVAAPPPAAASPWGGDGATQPGVAPPPPPAPEGKKRGGKAASA